LPYGVRTFLGPVKPARGRLADSPPAVILPAPQAGTDVRFGAIAPED
jgi:hypothetical protein